MTPTGMMKPPSLSLGRSSVGLFAVWPVFLRERLHTLLMKGRNPMS